MKKNKDKKSLTTCFFYVIMYAILFLITVPNSVMASMPVNKKVVALDAGHGDWDPGKMHRNVNEKDINLCVALKLQNLLETGGAIVFVTRADDTALADRKREDLNARASIANDAGADIFVSIHQNSFESASVSGAQVFYHTGSEQSRLLAEAIQGELNTFLEGNYRREAKASGTYYVLRKTSMPAVIVECGFMSNQRDLELLQKEDYQNRVAWAVYMGITKFFEEHPENESQER